MRSVARAAFAAVVVAFAAQVVVTQALGREPYPAIAQPAFGGQVPVGGVAVTRESAVTVGYADGTTAVYGHGDVMAASPLLRSTVFRSAFGPDSPRRTDPENVRWLERRVAALGGGREPVSIVVEEQRVTRELGTRDPETVVVVTARDVVDLESARA